MPVVVIHRLNHSFTFCCWSQKNGYQEYYFYSMFVLVVICWCFCCWFFFVVFLSCYAWDNTKKTSKCLTEMRNWKDMWVCCWNDHVLVAAFCGWTSVTSSCGSGLKKKKKKRRWQIKRLGNVTLREAIDMMLNSSS